MSGSPMLAPLQASASMTQLPPSPDVKSNSNTPGAPLMPEFSLDGTTRGGPPVPPVIRRLRSVAKYEAFFPKALACSSTLSSYDERGVSTTSSTSSSTLKNNDTGPSCLGAVAGPQGVALFRLSRPHVPLLILSHATNAASPNSISSLSFEPKDPSISKTVTNSLYLAATRGSGVLVWDASGHSPNPLVGRVGMDQALPTATNGISFATELEDSRLTSMCWMSFSASTSPLLATTTASAICLWDLRTPSSNFKPNTRFVTTRKTTGTAALSPLVQVACSHDSEECATIDTAGIVQIYDVRMNDRARGQGGNPLSTFSAHETAGVGISYFGTKSTSPDNDSNSSQSRWLTWGLDAPLSSAVVKIWTKNQKSSTVVAPTSNALIGTDESSWDPNARPPRPNMGSTQQDDYTLTAQCVRPNLACARVCLAPVQNKFMAIGHISNQPEVSSGSSTPENGNGWWAELYSLSEDADETASEVESLSIRTFGLEKVAGFQGGEATNAGDKRALVSVLGSRTKLGSLQAAELSLTNSVRDPGVDESTMDVELLLCCLSDTGVVSTHVVPEAIPKTVPFRSLETSALEAPKRSMTLRNNLLRTAFPSSNQARVYPEDREGTSLSDAANFWGVARTGTDPAAVLHRVEERRQALEARSSSPQNADVDDPMIPTLRRGAPEAGMMLFDMDVPVAYGSVTAGNTSNLQIGITDISTGAVVSTNSMGGVVEEGETVTADPLQKTSIMESIETERVPCPRLCGAVFGKGNGGLIIFHNGEVKKMWNWYQRTDSMRNPAGKGDSNSMEPESLRRVHNATGSGSTHPLSTQEEPSQSASKNGPRNLKELVSMVAAAKEAQWGEEIASDGSTSDDILSAGDNFFEDESLGSNSSDDDDDDGLETPPPAEDMYKRYFGGQPWKGNVVDSTGAPPSPSPSKTPVSAPSSPSARVKKIQPFLGPSSDMLSPVVSLTRRFDREMLGYQSIELAEGWELGPWDSGPNELVEELELTVEMEESKTEQTGPIDAAASQQALPHYRYLLNLPTRIPGLGEQFPPLVRTKSDGNLEKKFKRNYDANATITARTNDSFRRMIRDAGFQGGEGNVRPNMEESMKFLKKLFTQPQEGGPSGFSTGLSPPDRPRHLFTSHLPPEHRHHSTGEMSRLPPTGVISTAHGNTSKLGVYTLRIPKMRPDDSTKRSLDEIKRICLHNAMVCADLGDQEKEGVWNLLAQTVDRQLDEAGSQSFNGWGGNGGGALGVQLVGNLLKYFEARGDCQMLATMTCVLSGGRRSALRQQSQIIGNEDRPYLLPLDQDEKYDMYIRRYADLLYSWGLLSLRAELNKHLIRVPATSMNNDPAIPPIISGKQMGTIEENYDLGARVPGIAVVFQCPKCGDDTEFNTNICRNCRDFAFRCSICDNAVQGLFTVCDYCRHGGHVDHMTAWFAKHMECPTGCGCACTFSPLMASGNDVTAAAAMAENDPLQT